MVKNQCWRCGCAFHTAMRMSQTLCLDCMVAKADVGGLYTEDWETTRRLTPLQVEAT